jgi:hypothetical protein
VREAAGDANRLVAAPSEHLDFNVAVSALRALEANDVLADLHGMPPRLENRRVHSTHVHA